MSTMQCSSQLLVNIESDKLKFTAFNMKLDEYVLKLELANVFDVKMCVFHNGTNITDEVFHNTTNITKSSIKYPTDIYDIRESINQFISYVDRQY